MKIRKAEIQDVPRIAEIHVRSWQTAYKDQLPSEFLAALSVRQRESMWCSCLESDGMLFVVEGDDSEVIGFLNIGPSRDADLENATELMAIYLDPAFYGFGIGTAFWMEIERDVSTDVVFLWVLSSNALGIAFYEKNGFQPDGKKKTFSIGDQEFEELRYQKRLQR